MGVSPFDWDPYFFGGRGGGIFAARNFFGIRRGQCPLWASTSRPVVACHLAASRPLDLTHDAEYGAPCLPKFMRAALLHEKLIPGLYRAADFDKLMGSRKLCRDEVQRLLAN
jgi:hypothetical protein